jgi:release factor glutamine methyltransferase
MISSSIKGSKSLHKEIQKSLRFLYEEREASSMSAILIEYFFEMSRMQIAMDVPFVELEEELINNLNECIERLLKKEPIQHILGETEFYGSSFFVNKEVLIPRQETEELVDWVIKENQSRSKFQLLDIGTGSGCIPISIKHHFPQATISGLDVSQKALEVAFDNSTNNGVEVKWIQDDILNTTYSPESVDIIVSNPPYITELEKIGMDTNVLEYDPHLALFVENDQPLKFYVAIADFAKKYLSSNGQLYFEINEHYGNETIAMLKEKGFTEIKLKQDLNGKDRMIKAIK